MIIKAGMNMLKVKENFTEKYMISGSMKTIQSIREYSKLQKLMKQNVSIESLHCKK